MPIELYPKGSLLTIKAEFEGRTMFPDKATIYKITNTHYIIIPVKGPLTESAIPLKDLGHYYYVGQ